MQWHDANGNRRAGSEMGDMTKGVLGFDSSASTDKLSTHTHKLIQIHADEERFE